jgi:hypothetical protein
MLEHAISISGRLARVATTMASNADGACQVFDEMSTRNQNLNF